MLRLKQERLRRGWTLVEVTKRTGLEPSLVSQIERGLRVPYPVWRRRIAKAFKMSEEELFSEVKDSDAASSL